MKLVRNMPVMLLGRIYAVPNAYRLAAATWERRALGPIGIHSRRVGVR